MSLETMEIRDYVTKKLFSSQKLNLKLLNNIREAMFLTVNQAVVFKVKSATQGVIVFAEGNEFTIEDQLALIMPVAIHSDY